MTRPEQRVDERHKLETALRDLAVRPLNVLDGADPPDFLIKFADRTVAAEITDFHSSQQRREVEAAWEQITANARTAFWQNPLMRELQVNFKLHSLYLPARRQHNQFVADVISQCESNVGCISDRYSDLPLERASPLVLRYVKQIEVCRIGPVYPNWSCYGLSYGKIGLTDAELARVVLKKLKPPPDCGAAEAWLFVFGGGRLSQVIGLLNAERLNTYFTANACLVQSPYSRVYLCETQIMEWRRGMGWRQFRDFVSEAAPSPSDSNAL